MRRQCRTAAGTGDDDRKALSRKVATPSTEYVSPKNADEAIDVLRGGLVGAQTNFSKALAKMNKDNKVIWTCLDYRHTFGSQLAMKGESLFKISSLMGNSPEICRRHYAALVPEALAECVNF